MKSLFLSMGAACVLTLSGLFFSASAGEATPAPACHLRRAAYLDIFTDGGIRPVVKISLNGTLEYFLIDTAGVYNAISESAAKDLKMVVRKGNLELVHSATGTEINKYAYGKLKVGPLALPRIPMAVMPSDIMSSHIQGLLGGEFLRVFDLEIDPAAKKLSFFLHNTCGSRVVHWTNDPWTVLKFQMNNRADAGNWMVGQNVKDYHITVPAQLNNTNVSALIDTGSDVSTMKMGDVRRMLSSEEMKKVKLLHKPSDKDGDPEDAWHTYRFKSLNLNGLVVRNLKVLIFPGDRSHGEKMLDEKPELVLGDDVLNKLHMYISYGEKKLYITAAGAH